MRKPLALLVALLVLALPASAAAAPQEGPGTVTIAPDPLVVPVTTVGNQGEWLAVDVSYEGEGEAAIDKVSLVGAESGEFASNGSNCGTLQSGQQCTAWFALKPSSLGDKSAEVEVRFQGERPAELRPISGRSVPPQLSFSPSEYDFGIQRINRDSVSANFQPTNSGEAPVQPNNFDIQGDTDSLWTGNSDCWMMLAPGASCNVQVWFSPHEMRDYAGLLRVWANGEVFSAALEGRGGRAIVGATENPVGFGGAAIGSTVVKTITMTNSGNLAGGYFIAVIAGGDSGSFKLLSENCTMIALEPAASCSVRVRFEPQEEGSLSARFALFGDDEPPMVQLEGEGLAAEPTAATAASSDADPEATAARKVRKKRFGRGKGIHSPSRRAERRAELRASAARR
jgi:hypothetical protein